MTTKYLAIPLLIATLTSCTKQYETDITNDEITFHPPLYKSEAPERLTFKSCGSTEWGALHKNYFTSQYGSDAEITCTQHLPDESTLVRVGTESYCMKNYCDTLQIDKQYSMGRTTGIKLPKTRGDFVAIASSQNICRQAVNDCTAIPLCEMEKRVISKNPSSIVFSPANGTEWNYTIDTDRGTINTTISVIGTSGLGLSAIES